MIFVSIDGGATKTIAVAYDQDGRIFSIGVNGSSNFRNVGTESASKSIKNAINNALKRGGFEWNEVDYYTFALAGVKDSEKSTATIDEFISAYNLKGRYSLLNDGEAGFNCRFPGEDGIIAAPGTGMIAYGKSGELFERCSGWGWLIGDEGGAFYIGRRAIQESARIADGRSDYDSELLDSIMIEFSLKEPRKLVNEVYNDKIDIRKIASIAPLVSSLAKKGDIVSISLIREAASEAARCVVALQKKLGKGVLPVSGYGGVFRSGDIYWKPFTQTVLDSVPEAEFENPLYGYHAVIGSMYKILSGRGFNLSKKDVNGLANILDSKVMNLPEIERSRFLLM